MKFVFRKLNCLFSQPDFFFFPQRCNRCLRVFCIGNKIVAMHEKCVCDHIYIYKQIILNIYNPDCLRALFREMFIKCIWKCNKHDIHDNIRWPYFGCIHWFVKQIRVDIHLLHRHVIVYTIVVYDYTWVVWVSIF